MPTWNNIQKILFLTSLLLLLVFLLAVGLLVFSSRKKTNQFQIAERLYSLNSMESMAAAAEIYKELLAADENFETAYVRLAEICERQQKYPDSVFYWSRAQALNSLNRGHQRKYIGALQKTRQFQRLETYLNTLPHRTPEQELLKMYAASRNGSLLRCPKKLPAGNGSSETSALLLLLQSTVRFSLFNPSQIRENLLRLSRTGDFFSRQESQLHLAALSIRQNRLPEAEKHLREAARENFFAAGPELADFLATFRSFGKAIPVYEKYLSLYHDPLRAMQLAEIHTLLKNRNSLQAILLRYQNNPGKPDIYCCFYLNALLSFLDHDLKGVRQHLEPLHDMIRFPMVYYLRLCAALEEENDEMILRTFTQFTGSRNYLDLPTRASALVLEYIAGHLNQKKSSAALWELTEKLHQYHPSPDSAYLVLLRQWQKGILTEKNILDAAQKYPRHPGIQKIAVARCLSSRPEEAGRMIARFKQTFPEQKQTVIDLEIRQLLLTGRNDQASLLFQQNLSRERFAAYWDFASGMKRRRDLHILMNTRGAELYRPFCQACLLLLDGQKKQALDILSAAPVQDNQKLLFFAASTLAREGRHQEALKRYEEFPEKTPYELLILANTAELHQVCGNHQKALLLAEKAWRTVPDSPELQFCYADKLSRQNMPEKIPAVISLPKTHHFFQPELRKLWAEGIKAQMRLDLSQKKIQSLKQKLNLLRLYVPDDRDIAEFRKRIPREAPRP